MKRKSLKNAINKLLFCGEILFCPVMSLDEKAPIVVFDTSIGTRNLGDFIINDYCTRIFEELGIEPVSRITTHEKQTEEELKKLEENGLKIVTGTNILSSRLFNQWVRPLHLAQQNNILLMGVGWSDYNDKVTPITARYYRKVLSQTYKHCVRDRFTKSALRKAGITNVLYTGCPTMWNLTPALCSEIPQSKGKNVVCTITDYDRDQQADFAMLDILLQQYEKVFFWPQGRQDLAYISFYPRASELCFLERTLTAFDNLLRDQRSLDYVGTRLHGGIRALNHKVRSIVIAIDNRAIEIARDTGLKTIKRDAVNTELSDLIQSEFQTKLELPFDAIKEWKDQFNGKLPKQQNNQLHS